MIVVLDACVLYPPSLRDLLLTLAALDALEIRWSDEILDEVTRKQETPAERGFLEWSGPASIR